MILVGLAPERLSALCVRGRLRPRLLDRHGIPLAPPHEGRWRTALSELGALLDTPGWQGREIAVVLSSHYARHVVVPGAPGLTEAEGLALAGAVFRDTFGEAARDWEIRASRNAGAKPFVACGVSRALLQDLRETCAGRGRLRSVRPSLMPLFNQARRLIVGHSAGCLAMVETGRLTLASIQDGQWQSIHSRAGDGGALPHFLQEEGELHGRPPGGILWLCDLDGGARLPAGTAWSHRHLEPPHLPGMDEIPDLANWGLV